MNIVERILKYLEYKGITRYRFYKETGISNGYLDNRTSINSDKCEMICTSYDDLSVEWLIMERGEMIKPPTGLSPLKSEIPSSCCSELKDDIARYKRIIDEQSEKIKELKDQIAPTLQGQKRKAG